MCRIWLTCFFRTFIVSLKSGCILPNPNLTLCFASVLVTWFLLLCKGFFFSFVNSGSALLCDRTYCLGSLFSVDGWLYTVDTSFAQCNFRHLIWTYTYISVFPMNWECTFVDSPPPPPVFSNYFLCVRIVTVVCCCFFNLQNLTLCTLIALHSCVSIN